MLLCKLECCPTTQQQFDAFNNLHVYERGHDSTDTAHIVQQILSPLALLLTGNVDRSKLTKIMQRALPKLMAQRNAIMEVAGNTQQMRTDLSRFYANSYTMSQWSDETQSRLQNGNALTLGGSLINHSCDANCSNPQAHGKRHIVVSKVDIPADAEITACYCTSTDSYEARQHHLQQNYGFKCHCSKCQRRQ